MTKGIGRTDTCMTGGMREARPHDWSITWERLPGERHTRTVNRCRRCATRRVWSEVTKPHRPKKARRKPRNDSTQATLL